MTFIIIVIGVYAALSQFEIARTISTSLLQSGSLIIAVATFAAQQALGNVISGFFISATKPCEIGQKVKIMSGGNVIAEGIVRDMTVRHIFIEQFDGQSYIVPNSLADSSVIVNTNFVEDVGNYIEIEVGYDTDVEEARKIIQKICDEDPRILNNQKTKVLVSAITANGMLLKFTIWSKDLNDSFEACSNVRQRLVSEFLKGRDYDSLSRHLVWKDIKRRCQKAASFCTAVLASSKFSIFLVGSREWIAFHFAQPEFG